MVFFCDASSAHWRSICHLLVDVAYASKTRSFYVNLKVSNSLRLETSRLVRHLDIGDYVYILDFREVLHASGQIIKLDFYQQGDILFHGGDFEASIWGRAQELQVPAL